MSKVSKDAVKALLHAQPFVGMQTEVVLDEASKTTTLIKFGSQIARYNSKKHILVVCTPDGITSHSTVDILNTLLDLAKLPFSFDKKDDKWFLHNTETDRLSEWKGERRFTLK